MKRILVLLLAAVITALIRRKKSGKTACGCDCAFAAGIAKTENKGSLFFYCAFRQMAV